MKKIPYGKNLNTFLIIDKYTLQPYLSTYKLPADPLKKNFKFF